MLRLKNSPQVIGLQLQHYILTAAQRQQEEILKHFDIKSSFPRGLAVITRAANNPSVLTIVEKAFSWLKMPTIACTFPFKTLC